ncbi:hypothetical protein [Fodinicola feengrottensis]|uniref:hypothetical protein n=1 Tax=Fodinicola feengrottensis TaxID=435914 RepID=UPI0013D10AEA|nr:hypothetical protein [Fodinicola feengrottensis]
MPAPTALSPGRADAEPRGRVPVRFSYGQTWSPDRPSAGPRWDTHWMLVDWLGYGLGIALALPVAAIAVHQRRWWSWLELAGLALLAVAALRTIGAPAWLVTVGVDVGPPALVAGLVAWRLHDDAGWFARKDTGKDSVITGLTSNDHEQQTESGVAVPPRASTCED